MSDWLSYKSFIYAIGFLAQILFSARLLLQWIKSEKAKRVLTPQLFWELSLMASFLLFVYGWLRDDFAIMLGQILAYFIYIRNMQLQGSWQKLPLLLRWFLSAFPLLVIVYSFNNNAYDLDRLFKNEAISTKLLVWGSLAQVIFTCRFIYQWFYSEKRKVSMLPTGFWVLSLIGSLMILSYAIIRKDPVLFIGQIFGFIVYSRNITLAFKSKKAS
ncbi:MAG: lauroyl acyltransferase [Flavobacteriales bacterium CG_4_9_14_0_2_um_filter_35_242]|nr:MAG: lauroyl acyltransferase [Flavobacteriaceae bacterium CG1_02_35_72]PIV16161.1 MAG: lauroyl acyltransferase [Flavobacteriales bacterium CG03_land_8_20_14_0_80_35_15]PJC60278.1 MAG: lauroyl acyltransferase [Flavobacteriales bacterium CG_4_9_14_0_2_um_filter_35_242]